MNRMMSMWQDLMFATRALVKRPLYATVTVLVFALAIGANTTVFSVFNGFFLRPLPYPNDDRLVVVYNTYPKAGLEFAGTSIPDYLERRTDAQSLEDLAIFTFTQRSLGVEDTPEQIAVQRVSPSLFTTLGVGPLLGRTFGEDEASIGQDRVVVLSHTLWRTRFGGREGVIGSEVRLNGEPHTVVGVMPEGFSFPPRTQAWVPFAFTPEQMSDAERGNEFSGSIGRLRPGATLEGLNGELALIVNRNVERLGDSAAFIEATGFTGKARMLREFTVGELRPMLLVLQASVLAVLLIACANVANLQLARMVARRKELSIRSALGAGRGQLARLVLAESVLLSGLGAIAGVFLAAGGLQLVRILGLDRADQGFEFALDARVLGFTALVALLAALIAAVLPMMSLWRERLAETLKDAGRIGSGGRAALGLRNTLVVVQIAMSVALLVGAGLLTRSFIHLQQAGPGFDADGVLTARISLPTSRYGDADAMSVFYARALEELSALPGVTYAALTSVLPFSGVNSQGSVAIDGYTPPDGVAPPHAQLRSISEDYFPAMGMRLVQGRNFVARESERVAIIDQNMARRYWPEGNAIGQRVRRSGDPGDHWYTVIGVAPVVKEASLTDDPTKETIYWYYLQRPDPFGAFVLRTALPPEQLSRASNDAILAIDPDLPLFDVRTLEHRVIESLGPQRAPMVLALVFAGVAFTLAVIGVYGVLTWAVTQRVGEIGVRMALGAQASDIVSMVLQQGGRLTLVGLVVGFVAAVGLSQAMASQIHAVGPRDPWVFGLVLFGLGASALLASWLPALRAARIDPMVALRDS